MKVYFAIISAMICLMLFPPHPAAAEEESFKAQVTALLGSEDSQALAGLSGKTIYATPFIYRMYQDHGFRLIWDDAAIASLSTALDTLEEDGLTPGDYRVIELDARQRAQGLAGLGSEQRVEVDILLTEVVLRALYNLYFGKADPQRIDADINFTRSYSGEDPLPLILGHLTQGRIQELFDWARCKNKGYKWLKTGLARYREYQAAGGWASILPGETLKPGTAHPRVVMMRKRLSVTGDLPQDAAAPGNEKFDDNLKSAVERFQARHGLGVDGVVGPETLKTMNVPVQARIDQIRINLERVRWIYHEAYSDFLLADIAGFNIAWIKDGNLFWKEQIQVGKTYTKTPVFKGEIRYMDFNPTWTIPPGILRKSVIPALKRDPEYLDKKGYLLLTFDGKPVDPKSVNWKTLKGFPYMVRQPAGPNNALGQVKFLFPNPHFVFLHDTNHREYFDRTRRTFSSGCIRVRNPFDLAERLLANQEGWSRARIDEVVATGKTKRVLLKHPMRILIAYNTARATAADGRVDFRADVYQRDTKVLTALDGPFQLHRREGRTNQ
jgi:murein L,D-transpeptidase YcbB/YkuD